MSMIDQMNQTGDNVTDTVVVFRDRNGGAVLFDRITGQSCAVARHCPNTGTDQCDSGEGCSAC